MIRGGSALLIALAAAGCTDVSSYSNAGDHYEGTLVPGDFVRSGIEGGTRLCLSLDAARLQSDPGAISASDGRFGSTPLRPIPQLWHDSLSTLAFGEGRARNLVYAVADAAGDDLAIVSLMQGGKVEVRLIRGAPSAASDAGDATANLFAVFELARTPGPCPF